MSHLNKYLCPKPLEHNGGHQQYPKTISISAAIEHAFSITPSNSDELSFSTRGLYVGLSGDVKVDLIGSGTARSLVWLLVSFTRSASRRCTRLAQPRRTSSE